MFHPFQSFIEKHDCIKRKCVEKQLLFCVENNVCLKDSVTVKFEEIEEK